MRQLNIARKDLQMSPGKLTAQCCHVSLAFLASKLRDKDKMLKATNAVSGEDGYDAEIFLYR